MLHTLRFSLQNLLERTYKMCFFFIFYYSSVLNCSTCFGRHSAHHQELNDCSGSLWFYLRIVVTVVLCSWLDLPRTQHDCHHDTKVKPEAATAVVELLMMGGKTPETCWAVNKRQDNKLKTVASGWWFIWIEDTTMYQNFIIPYLYEAQQVSGDTLPIVRSPKLHWQPLVFHMLKVVGRVVSGRCQAVLSFI
jgi:hypothetical protein